MSDGPPDPVVPDGMVQCSDCGAVVSEEQALVKRTTEGEPDVTLCPVCQ